MANNTAKDLSLNAANLAKGLGDSKDKLRTILSRLRTRNDEIVSARKAEQDEKDRKAMQERYNAAVNAMNAVQSEPKAEPVPEVKPEPENKPEPAAAPVRNNESRPAVQERPRRADGPILPRRVYTTEYTLCFRINQYADSHFSCRFCFR